MGQSLKAACVGKKPGGQAADNIVERRDVGAPLRLRRTVAHFSCPHCHRTHDGRGPVTDTPTRIRMQRGRCDLGAPLLAQWTMATRGSGQSQARTEEREPAPTAALSLSGPRPDLFFVRHLDLTWLPGHLISHICA